MPVGYRTVNRGRELSIIGGGCTYEGNGKPRNSSHKEGFDGS